MNRNFNILLAIALLMSIGAKGADFNNNLQTEGEDLKVLPLPKQSLAQFVFDIYAMDGIDGCLETLDLYAESPKFYLSSNEVFNALHLIYSSGKIDEAEMLLERIKVHIPKIRQSLAQNLFEILLKDGVEKGRVWLKDNMYSSNYYSGVFELERTTRTMIELKLASEAKVLAELHKIEDLNEDDAYYVLAELALADGDEKLALQHMNEGVKTNDYITFMELALNPLTKYIPTILPTDTTLLFKSNGDLENDTAYVFIQGGPMPDLSAYNPRPLDLLPEHTLRIDVLQSQMVNQSILSADPILTDDQCLYEHNQSAEMMHRTIKYLKDRDKVVFAIGHSYGCFIGYEYLLTKDNLADKLILMGADLDENPQNFALNEDGSRKFIRWRNGTEPYEQDFWTGFPLVSILRPKMEKIFTNTGNLVAARAKQKFTQLLKGKDLSNVTFYFARYDEANGRTTQAELDFFETHGATTFECFGDHHSMLSKKYIENMYNYLTKSDALKYSVASELARYSREMSVKDAIQKVTINRNGLSFFTIEESEINALGYEYVSEGKLTDALEIFKFNADQFPNSWNVYDSAGETYLTLGNKTLAKEYYQKSLDIHPGNTYALQALKSLK